MKLLLLSIGLALTLGIVTIDFDKAETMVNETKHKIIKMINQINNLYGNFDRG